MQNYYKSGTWNAICDVCGFKHKADTMKMRWDGLLVCKEDYETDHPQKYIRVRETGIAVEPVRPDPEEVFTQTCDIWTSSPMADFGTADCMTVGGNTNIPFLISLFNPTSIAGLAIAGRSIAGVL